MSFGLFDSESKITFTEFDFFRCLIRKMVGIHLADSKMDLVESRLRPRIRELKLRDFNQYINFLNSISSNHSEWPLFINCLTTNKTDWFREPEHFKFITDVFLPRWKKLGKNHLCVWSAASSTGEEAYTLSIVLYHALKGSGITYEIIATDIDTNVLARAQNGVYSKEYLRQISKSYHQHFVCGEGEISDWMKVRQEIKDSVQFKRLNLILPYPWTKYFDIILCRNVMIYFEQETISQVAGALSRAATDEGVLLIGHSETLKNADNSWQYYSPSIYYKKNILK